MSKFDDDELDERDDFLVSSLAVVATAIALAILIGGILMEQSERERLPVAQVEVGK